MPVTTKFLSDFIVACLITGSSITSVFAQNDNDAYVDLNEPGLNEASEFAAVIRSAKSAVLSSQIEGVVAQIEFAEGESFLEGDKLLSIDCTVPAAERKKARAHLRFAVQEHQANVSLSKLDSISDVALARSAVEVEKATVEAESARYKVDQCDLYAPFSGNVVRLHVQQFENVPEKSQLLEIVNNQELRIEFLLPSEYLTRLEDSHGFELYVLETDKTYPATVQRIIPYVDSVSQTVKVVAQLTVDSDDLWSGMSGFARFSTISDR